MMIAAALSAGLIIGFIAGFFFGCETVRHEMIKLIDAGNSTTERV